MISLYFFVTLNVLIGLTMGLTPYISRKSFPFGINLPVVEETESVIKNQKKSYFLINFGLSLILGILLLIISSIRPNTSEETLVYYSMISMFILLIVSLYTYITRHKFLKNYKQNLTLNIEKKQRVLVDLSFRDEKLIFPTSYLVGINLVFVLLSVFVTVLNYDNIPEMIVTQWDFNMNPSSFTEKSWLSVMAIPMLQLFLTAVMGVTNQAYVSAKQQIDGKNPEVSAAKSKAFRKKSSLLNLVISILTQLLMLSIQIAIVYESVSPSIIMWLSIGFTVIILGITLWFSLRYGQGGDRLQDVDVPLMEGEKHETYDDNDDYWKLGMIYFNKNDPAFWVEKRMGVGMTFNFARWESWAFMLGVLIIPFIIAFFMS